MKIKSILNFQLKFQTLAIIANCFFLFSGMLAYDQKVLQPSACCMNLTLAIYRRSVVRQGEEVLKKKFKKTKNRKWNSRNSAKIRSKLNFSFLFRNCKFSHQVECRRARASHSSRRGSSGLKKKLMPKCKQSCQNHIFSSKNQSNFNFSSFENFQKFRFRNLALSSASLQKKIFDELIHD